MSSSPPMVVQVLIIAHWVINEVPECAHGDRNVFGKGTRSIPGLASITLGDDEDRRDEDEGERV